MKKVLAGTVVVILSLAFGCSDLQTTDPAGDPVSEAIESAAESILAPEVNEATSSTVCRAYGRHLSQVEVEMAGSGTEDLEPVAAALLAVITDICG